MSTHRHVSARICIAATTWIAAMPLLLPTPAAAEDADRIASLQDDAVEHLVEYLRLDTINPPGNEARAVEFFARIFEAEGIEYQTAESAPGRGNIWARLKGGVEVDAEPGLVLLHHSDVVPADPRYWDEHPLSGKVRDGYLYGRGALDTKSLGILHLEAFLELHRRGRPLVHDVIFMATADEEAGGLLGAGWLVEHRPEIFAGVGFVLNEGGGGVLLGDRPVFNVEVTQKVPLWLRLTARGVPGHGSTPRSESAVTRLVAALARLASHPFEPRAVPAVRRYFEGLAQLDAKYAAAFANLDRALESPEFLRDLQRDNPQFHALLRNTCSITGLAGSNKINVVPPQASAELDCRLLPDQGPGAFLEELRRVLADPEIEIETLMAFTPAVSRTDTALYRAIEAECLLRFPQSAVLPSVVSGFTDSHFFRDLGITAYGFDPVVVPVAEAAGVHGNNERLRIEDLREGVPMMLAILERVVYATD